VFWYLDGFIILKYWWLYSYCWRRSKHTHTPAQQKSHKLLWCRGYWRRQNRR